MSNTLEEIKTLGMVLSSYKTELQKQEDELSAVKEMIRRIEEETLPQMMDDLGITDITLEDGSKISCGDFIAAKIKDPATAFKWLQDTDNDGIIKNEVKVVLGRGEDEKAEGVMKLLEEQGIPAKLDKTIHHSTLRAFVKEALDNPELADSLPKAAFGVYEARRVTFK